MAQILHDLQPNSEKPHVFREATYDVTVRNTYGFSNLILMSQKVSKTNYL